MTKLRTCLSLLCLIALLAPGCAAGGGDGEDSGPGAMDAGPAPDTDAGPGGGTDAGPGGDTDAGPGGGTDAGPGGGTDAGPMGSDAGPGADAGPMIDAGFDAGGPPPCTSAADCSDGVACNGIEICSAGVCLPGTPLVCDDGVSCTIDTCVEPTGSCNFTPTDSLCPAGQTCGATGCMGTCMETPCRLVSPQCGCSTGQGCYVSGASRLCATAGTAMEGADCTGTTSCVPGNLCVNISRSTTTTINQCSRFCDTDADCAGNGICFYTLNDGMGGTVPNATLCTVDCDPVAQTGCRAGAMCTILQESAGAMRIFTDCIGPIGAGGQGAACASGTDCQAGYACVGSPGQCLRWCDRVGMIGTAGGCATGEACYGFMTPLTIGTTTYGVCDTYP